MSLGTFVGVVVLFWTLCLAVKTAREHLDETRAW